MTLPFGPTIRFDVEDFDGVVVASIRDYTALSFDIIWSGKGNYQLSLSGFDDRISKFVDDYQVSIWLKDENFGLDWTNVFTGFHKTSVKSLFQSKQRSWQSFGPSLEELIAKEYILWYAGSPQANKTAIPVSTAMTQYIQENIGTLALAASGRDADGVVTGLSVAGAGFGPNWSGGRARKPLMQVIKELRDFSIANDDQVDFRVVSLPGYTWEFQAGKLGVDRTTVGLDPATGLNGAGNVPVTFSEGQGNVLSTVRSKARTNAISQIVALGKGELENRAIRVAIDALEIAKSPIARRVGTVTSNTEDLTELSNAAQARLRARQVDDKFTFQPRDVGDIDPSKGGTVLFRDYNVGDFITAFDDGDTFHKQIVRASFTVTRGDTTIVSRILEYADV